jgi:uncharacterized SAM-binding protein YcdF (DUF218 family)
MFILKKLLEAFLLPPGFVVVALGALAFYLWKKERRAALVCAVLAGVIWGGTTRAFSDALMRPLENAYKTPARPQGDAIVLLCAGFRGEEVPYSASERLSHDTLERAAAAYKLYKDTGLPLLISGGAPFSSRPEAEAAAAYLAELGVPASKIIPEVRARDTMENASYTAKLCADKGCKKIILVTSAFHMPRAVLLFRRAGFAGIEPFPVARRSGPSPYRTFMDYLPGGGLEARQALNEYSALVVYHLYNSAPKS